MTARLSINAGQCSDKGIKELNEDACGILIPDEPLLTTKGIAAVIADGVSSSESAREASETCVTGFLNDYFSTPESWTVKTAGQRILGAQNRWLHSQAQKASRHDGGMLTTLSALIIKSTTAHIFHIGDTRIHRLRDGQLECLTQDHQVWVSGNKSFLSRAMGASINLDIDYRKLPVEIGDTFLLTCDGVHEFISNRDLTTLLKNIDNPERAAREIITRALENGSHDNVTCQLLHIENLPSQNEAEFYRHLTELPFPPPLDNGMIIDGYKIIRELHASKRTQIYLAVEQQSGHKVVLKTPSVNYDDDPIYIDQFLHEEWIGRRLNSPHILKVIEPVQNRHFLYYVTEYIEGQTLRQWMTDHPTATLDETRKIISQIATGLRAFHRMEMIHQDLKPENIMLDNHNTVCIIDFGSTKIAGIQEISTPIDRHGLLGTLNYAAPEYFLDQPGSDRSDIYALGVITYELLTGRLPYTRALSAKNIKLVRYTDARTHHPEIPPWIDGALEKATQLNPQLRYDHLSEFIYDLSHPNKAFLNKTRQPLIERNPLAFWQGITASLVIIIVVLLYKIANN